MSILLSLIGFYLPSCHATSGQNDLTLHPLLWDVRWSEVVSRIIWIYFPYYLGPVAKSNLQVILSGGFEPMSSNFTTWDVSIELCWPQLSSYGTELFKIVRWLSSDYSHVCLVVYCWSNFIDQFPYSLTIHQPISITETLQFKQLYGIFSCTGQRFASI